MGNKVQNLMAWRHGGKRLPDVPRGHFAVYVGERRRRFVIPTTYLNEPLFQELLRKAEEEFGFDQPVGGLTIPCSEDYFVTLTSLLRVSSPAAAVAN